MTISTILCYGDSNTYGYDPSGGGRFPRSVRWPGVLSAELGPEFEVIEEGLNGRTTVWDDPFSPGRNGASYLLPCLLSHAPVDLVVLMLGTNDLKAIFRIGAPEIASGAGTLLRIIQSSGAGPDGRPPHALLVIPPPVEGGLGHNESWGFGAAAAESRRFPALFGAIAEETGCDLLDAGAVVASSAVDGIHLDQEAHRRLGQAITEKLRARGLLNAPRVS